MTQEKKEQLTEERILADVKNSIRQVKRQTEEQDRRGTAISVLLLAGLLILAAFRPSAILWIFLGLFSLVLLVSLGVGLWNGHRIRRVSMAELRMVREVVSHVDEEHYRTIEEGHPTANGLRHQVDNYTLYFESGKIWRIPERNYAWSEERPMSAWYIFENTHQGDVFWAVIRQKTGEVLMAYDTKFFSYRP